MKKIFMALVAVALIGGTAIASDNNKTKKAETKKECKSTCKDKEQKDCKKKCSSACKPGQCKK